jgi:hypothetical protein
VRRARERLEVQRLCAAAVDQIAGSKQVAREGGRRR